jgi:hypothetical protein
MGREDLELVYSDGYTGIEDFVAHLSYDKKR